MENKFELLQDDPLKIFANVLIVFFSSSEPTRLYKRIQGAYKLLNADNGYYFYHNEVYPPIVALELDFHKNYKEYIPIFDVVVPWLINTYGKVVTFGLPECDNLQSISMGLFGVLKKYIESKARFQVYTETDYNGGLKPLIESAQFAAKKVEHCTSHVVEYFKCSQCGKFPYVPSVKSCCSKIVCDRCAFRDVVPCATCGSQFEAKDAGSQIVSLCKSSPWLCKCGQVIVFSEVNKHLKTCHVAEIECRVCNEMTKFSNFAAHFRMCHKELLVKLVSE